MKSESSKVFNGNGCNELAIHDTYTEEYKEFIKTLKNDWEDIQFIAKGSFGLIVKAKKKNGILNGIKLGDSYCIIKRKKRDPNVLIFDNESDILKTILSLKSKLLLKYYYHEIKAEYVYIYTEYFEGQTIGLYVKENNRIKEEENIIFITWSILRALELLHRNCIMHRDISPNNILVSKDFKEIKLIDFGHSIALLTGSKSLHHGGLTGTLGFIAPEIIYENNHPGRGSDIWSLGAMVLFMYGYILPKSGELIIPQDIPQNIQSFLKDSLKKRYNERATAINLLQNGLFSNLNQEHQQNQQNLELNDREIIIYTDKNNCYNSNCNNSSSSTSSSSLTDKELLSNNKSKYGYGSFDPFVNEGKPKYSNLIKRFLFKKGQFLKTFNITAIAMMFFIIVSAILLPVMLTKYLKSDTEISEYKFNLYQYNQYMEEGKKNIGLGQFNDAKVSYERALNVSKLLDKDQYILDSYKGIFDSVYSGGNYNEALVIAESYIAVSPTSITAQLQYHQMRGMVFFNTGKLQPCIDERLLVVKYTKQIYQNNSNQEAYSQVGVGTCYAEHGRYQDAIKYYTIAFNIYQTMNSTYRDKYYYAASLFHLGYSYFHSENLTNYMEESFKYFNQSYIVGLELYKEDSDKYYIFLTDRQNYLGRWYIQKGDPASLDLGFKFLKQSESILREKSKFKIPEMAETLYLLGQIERLRSNYERALEYQHDVLSIRVELYTPTGNILRPSIAEACLEIGQDLVHVGNCTDVVYCMERAKQIYDTFDNDSLIKNQLSIINSTISYCESISTKKSFLKAIVANVNCKL
ncbi:hypothetical protein DICPUDRAFT_146705 [Dictyostelium purpureum]|uniref:Protein kinase domain-containing protein n=1 Tax=Dictyostelium purpureum TaxID=5786 RepID=F0Z6T5_DICPU|nr:uncharacterized protein DICPUDRAFT_146705 [Dictyostelium purpureum]EGC40365.1 hypothetical protein DICPUDRAFT_146705 [Dictyostelium purpureum]|eukprot:XP_003283116.1 hypothetical protein DICPUDRAFT_146705 [Dictyostelium purpureum]